MPWMHWCYGAARIPALHDDREPAHELVRLDAAGQKVLARITCYSAATLLLHPGQQVHAHVQGVALKN
jgi:molybdate transport system ATP-binding protein